MHICVRPGTFEATPLQFMDWRLLLAKTAGYKVVGWEHDEILYLVPDLDYENIDYANLMGVWEEEPEDILVVLLAHSDEAGSIPCEFLPKLIERIQELLPDLHMYSEHAQGSEELTKELDLTEAFIKGCQIAILDDLSLTFYLEHDNEE